MTVPSELAQRFWDNVNKNGPEIRPGIGKCWEWIGILFHGASSGYGRFSYGKIDTRAHVMSWLLAGFEIPDGAIVCHECDNRKCVNPAHLYLGTKQTNTQDMYDRERRSQRGVSNGNHRLTEQQVLEIKQSSADAHTLGWKYGVHHFTIERIRDGRLWPNIS